MEVLKELKGNPAARDIEVFKDGQWRVVAEEEGSDDDEGTPAPPPSKPSTSAAPVTRMSFYNLIKAILSIVCSG